MSVDGLRGWMKMRGMRSAGVAAALVAMVVAGIYMYRLAGHSAGDCAPSRERYSSIVESDSTKFYILKQLEKRKRIPGLRADDLIIDEKLYSESLGMLSFRVRLVGRGDVVFLGSVSVCRNVELH